MSAKVNEGQKKRRARVRTERANRGARVITPPDDGIGAFPLGEDGQPISVDTPGQRESRAAFERFNAARDKCPWWVEYLDLRAEGWDWRKAALIAWLASPKSMRWPKTLYELATEHMGLTDSRSLRQWCEDDPEIDERVGVFQARPLFEHRRDVIEALVAVAKKHDHLAHQDRKLFLTLTGDVRPDGKSAEPPGESDFSDMGEDEVGAITGAMQDQVARSGAA